MNRYIIFGYDKLGQLKGPRMEIKGGSEDLKEAIKQGENLITSNDIVEIYDIELMKVIWGNPWGPFGGYREGK